MFDLYVNVCACINVRAGTEVYSANSAAYISPTRLLLYTPYTRTTERMKGGGRSVGDTLALTGGTHRLWQRVEASKLGLGAVLSTTAAHELVYAGSMNVTTEGEDATATLPPTTVWTVPGGAQGKPEGSVAPLVFGFEVPAAGGMISAMLEVFGNAGFGSSSCGTLSDGNCLNYMLELLGGKSVSGTLSVVFASEGFGTAESPGLVPPSMHALQHVKKVDAGFSLFLTLDTADDGEDSCTDLLCIFLHNAFNDPPVVAVTANFGVAELIIEATVGSIAVIKDECTRPSGILDEVAIFAEYPYAAPTFSKAKPHVGVRAAFAVDMARIKPGPGPSAESCSKVIKTKHDFEEPLLFEAVITLYQSYFAVSANMKGVWREAFGIQQFYLGNVVVGLEIPYVPPTLSMTHPLRGGFFLVNARIVMDSHGFHNGCPRCHHQRLLSRFGRKLPQIC